MEGKLLQCHHPDSDGPQGDKYEEENQQSPVYSAVRVIAAETSMQARGMHAYLVVTVSDVLRLFGTTRTDTTCAVRARVAVDLAPNTHPQSRRAGS